jgi:hypothetical protein
VDDSAPFLESVTEQQVRDVLMHVCWRVLALTAHSLVRPVGHMCTLHACVSRFAVRSSWLCVA